MAALHNALKVLGPIEFESVPTDHLKPFLEDAFVNSQLLIDSVPLPPPPGDSPSPAGGRSRAASSASEISVSNARAPPPVADHELLQKEWGKPLKLKAAENPLNMSVYKLSGKDGNGAWFARRSVHEGLGFKKWKKALQSEFPESTKVRGGPGEGNVRGIGGERKVEEQIVDGVGKMDGKY